jgi:hypothetical protein
MPSKLTNETFIQKANLLHNNKYDYSLVDYKSSKEKVSIICKEHGVYEQIPNDHLKPHGCTLCSYEAQAAIAKAEFATKASIIHDNKYDYSLVEYKNNATKVKIGCSEHGIFEQKPNSHLQGKGCPICALTESGFTRTKFKDKCIKNNNALGILYVLGCWSENKKEVFIKIGITSNSIKKRYPSKTSMPYNYKVLHEITGSPEYIYNLETLLHKKSKNYKYIPITSFGGSSTECFEANKDYLTNLNTYMKELVPF